LSYTLTLSGNAFNNGPELTNASKRTITASAASGQGGTIPLLGDSTCSQASQVPGGCARGSQTQTYYVVISQ
jgi:hypothetical protein